MGCYNEYPVLERGNRAVSPYDDRCERESTGCGLSTRYKYRKILGRGRF